MPEENKQTCPFLGIPGDATTHYQFPSRINYCHVPEKPESIKPQHQTGYCLTPNYAECPVYRQEGIITLPPEIRGANTHSGKRSQSGQSRILWIVLGLLVLVGGWIVISKPFSTPISSVGEQATNSPASELSQTGENPENEKSPILETNTATIPVPTATRTPLPSATPQPTVTSTPTVTKTPFPTPGPGPGTPFGPSELFVIHIVQEGESFTSISRKYETTNEVLEAINILVPGQSLWPGRQIVAVFGATEALGLPIFEVYRVSENTDINELAEEFSSDPDQIRLYNELGESMVIPAGRWLIIPHLEEE
jgi:LysM repeat protein